MKNYDFLFAYEMKNREIESICLLKSELERRGYSVAVVDTLGRTHHYQWSISATVMVVFALYTESQMQYFIQEFCPGCKAILNLQWEQIYTNSEEGNLNSLHHIKGGACKMMHVAWGDFTTDKLVNQCDVPKQNVIQVGHIAMDFIKPRFNGYYMGRDELLQQYEIAGCKKVLLFISSFGYVGMPKSVLESESYQNVGMSATDFQKISILSQATLFQWIQEILPGHPECAFIYRPHPAEVGNEKLAEMERKLPNFYVIRDYSIKQWIVVADKIYTWYSTSVTDAYFCGKRFEILRPVELPYDREVTLFNGCKFITSSDDFNHSIDRPASEFPIKEETFRHFFFFFVNIYTYSKICDALEALLNEPGDRCAEFRQNTRFSTIRRLLKMPLSAAKRWCKKRLGRAYIAGVFQKIQNPLAEMAKLEAYAEKMIQNNYTNKAEIAMLQNRIQQVIDSNLHTDHLQ